MVETFISAKGERLIVIGGENGTSEVKSQQHVLTEECLLTLKPEDFSEGQSECGEVTCIKCVLVEKDILMIGTAKGYVMIYDYEKREHVKMYRLEADQA